MGVSPELAMVDRQKEARLPLAALSNNWDQVADFMEREDLI